MSLNLLAGTRGRADRHQLRSRWKFGKPKFCSRSNESRRSRSPTVHSERLCVTLYSPSSRDMGNDDRLNNNEWNGFPQRMVYKRNVRRLRVEGIVTEELRLTVKERSLESIRKLRCAGRITNQITAPVARRITKAAPHTGILHPIFP